MNIAPRLYAAFIAALAIASSSAARGADAPSDTLSEADHRCLACHGERGLEKTFGAGETVALHVDAPAFAKSVHASIGCAACHADVDLARHPAERKTFATARAFSIAMTQSCRDCHAASYDAHTAGVHGKAASGEAASAAPLCLTCHGTHEIAHASVGTALRDTCLGCHSQAPAAHDAWLPNAKLHLEVVSCAACHAPTAGKRVELRFYDVAGKRELVTDGRPIAVAGNGANGQSASQEPPVDERMLRDLVRAIDRGGGAGKVVLAGRIEPADGAEGHRLVPKSGALKECATCHRKGADPFQDVSLAIVGPDGERQTYAAEKEVLHTLGSLESVRGFYAIGGTRIGLLDVLLGLALLGGISAPLGHLIMRKLARRKDKSHG